MFICTYIAIETEEIQRKIDKLDTKGNAVDRGNENIDGGKIAQDKLKITTIVYNTNRFSYLHVLK